MNIVIVGYGTQGKKRIQHIDKKSKIIAIVDPISDIATYRTIYDVPLQIYDTVFLCVPDEIKEEYIIYLAKNNKNVLVEKPLILTNLNKLNYLEKIVSKNKAIIYTAYNHRFEPNLVYANKIIKSGFLGRIYSCKLFYGNGTAKLVKNSPWRDKKTGVFSDLAPHLIDLCYFWFGEKNIKDVNFNLYGNQILIEQKLNEYSISNKNIKIFNTTSVVSDEETPLTAVKNSKNSSMWNSINSQLLDGADITLSAGNTGVLLVISRMILKTINGVSKPALAGLWPNKLGMNIVLDLGANIECDEKNLVEFAEMGSALYKSLFENNKPKVALLNIGSEEIKGTDVIKKAHTELKEISKKGGFDFNGYIEGNKITEGNSNVIVTDGFTGNIALKTAEGTAKFITDNLKKYLTENILSKISIVFSYFSLKKFKDKLDPRKFNGAIFLGLNGPVVKSHGSTDAIGFYHSIDLCYKIIKGNLMDQIKSNLDHLNGRD